MKRNCYIAALATLTAIVGCDRPETVQTQVPLIDRRAYIR